MTPKARRRAMRCCSATPSRSSANGASRAPIRWSSAGCHCPGEEAYDIGGDTVTEWGSRLLASVCDGNLEPIKQLILNREADEFCRGSAVDALAVLAAWGERTTEEVTDYFCWLASEGLEREFSHVWSCLASACMDIEAIPAFAELRRAYDEGLIDPDASGRRNWTKWKPGRAV